MSKSTDRKVKILDVTPALAERWLNQNTHNRPLRNTLVSKYALAMKSGEWKLTAEPIAFSKPFIDTEGKQHKETLIEGQHRLFALIESGVASVPMTVWFNCEPDEFKVIGQGATRTQGDLLSINDPGLKDPTVTAAVISSVVRFGFGIGDTISGWQTHTMLNAFRAELIATTEDKKKLRKLMGRPSIASFFLARLINPGMVDLIVDQMRNMTGFTERDPIRALHMYLQEQIQVGGRKEAAEMVHYKTSHALCARLRGEPLKILRITTEGVTYLRDAASKRIEPVVREVAGGRLPKNFYTPTLQFYKEDKPEPSVDLARVEQLTSVIK